LKLTLKSVIFTFLSALQFRDYLALAGDAVDNVPGAKGIGPKTATQLIQQYGDLDSIMAHAHEHSLPVRLPQPKLQTISENNNIYPS